MDEVVYSGVCTYFRGAYIIIRYKVRIRTKIITTIRYNNCARIYYFVTVQRSVVNHLFSLETPSRRILHGFDRIIIRRRYSVFGAGLDQTITTL